MKKVYSSVLALLASLLCCTTAHAYSAIAWSEGYTVSTIYAAWSFTTQKAADTVAVNGCRKHAREGGLSKAAGKCEVVQRQKRIGAGAIVCGKTGCATSAGYGTRQDAVDTAYQRCAELGFGECRETDITSWWDEAGYPMQLPKNAVAPAKCGPPPGRTVRSTYECNNGDCTRTFENGCTVRFQAPYCHDPFSGRWEWKADGC